MSSYPELLDGERSYQIDDGFLADREIAGGRL